MTNTGTSVFVEHSIPVLPPRECWIQLPSFHRRNNIWLGTQIMMPPSNPLSLPPPKPLTFPPAPCLT